MVSVSYCYLTRYTGWPGRGIKLVVVPTPQLVLISIVVTAVFVVFAAGRAVVGDARVPGCWVSRVPVYLLDSLKMYSYLIVYQI